MPDVMSEILDEGLKHLVFLFVACFPSAIGSAKIVIISKFLFHFVDVSRHLQFNEFLFFALVYNMNACACIWLRMWLLYVRDRPHFSL